MFSTCSCVNIFASVITLGVVLFAYVKWKFQYWQRQNLQYLQPRFPFGNASNPFSRDKHPALAIKDLYDSMKTKRWKHGGFFRFLSPNYLIVDLDYLKNVMTKDFHYFVDRGPYYNEKVDPLSAHLFAVGGEKWRQLRTKLTPTYTSGKLKIMFQTLLDCVPNLVEKIEAEKNSPINIKNVLECFTIDIIGSCAFGIKCNSFKGKDHEFRAFGEKLFILSPLQAVTMFVGSVFPSLAHVLRLRVVPEDVSKFFMNFVKNIVRYRKENKIKRNDFLQLLLDLENFTFEEIAAQSYIFFLGGYETSSTTMTFALYELARKPEIQEQVRNEINKIFNKHNGKITYDSIHEMKYLNQVIDETLRLYPPISFLTRKCVKDYKVPDEDLIIEKGTRVIIPVLGIHYDEEYYPEPEKFDPERFSEENKNARHSLAHIPFGEGPRLCIGMRFALMETKIGLASVLKHYKLTVNQKTQEPLKIKKNVFVPTAEGGIWLNAEKI